MVTFTCFLLSKLVVTIESTQSDVSNLVDCLLSLPVSLLLLEVTLLSLPLLLLLFKAAVLVVLPFRPYKSIVNSINCAGFSCSGRSVAHLGANSRLSRSISSINMIMVRTMLD